MFHQEKSLLHCSFLNDVNFRIMYIVIKAFNLNNKSSSRMASSSQQDSISFFQKLLRMFLNAFARRPAANLMMSLMQ
jgi:hypothetical protein